MSKRRKLTAREQLMRRNYTTGTKWFPGCYVVHLRVDLQSFTVGGDCKSQKKADWLRDMLAIALSRIV